MADPKILTDLKKCMRDCDGDPTCMAACELAFKQAGGTVTAEGGKVFGTPDGSKAFVTTGGKVF
jgi:hypothetical protein